MSADPASSPIDKLVDQLNDPRVAQFIYYTAIALTGFILLNFLSNSGYEFTQSLIYMGLWLLLIILLEPPTAAQLQSHPFEDTDIVPDRQAAK